MEIQPYSFPTTVVFVDDNAAFLSNLSLQFDPKLAFRFFGSSSQALQYVNTQEPSGARAGRMFVPYRDRTDENDAQQVVAMSVEAIRRLVYDARRFHTTSVVVVDYDMPGIDGLEFCRHIANPAIRKIMLTGKADEHLAVKGFNEGVIDRFIRKHDIDAIDTLNRALVDMQNAYFEWHCRSIRDILSVSEYAFLKDEGFAAHLAEQIAALGIVEHYLSYQPNGLLMFDSAGTPWLLIVHTDESLRGVREIAVEQGAPEDFLAELDSLRTLPYFWHSEGYYPAREADWRPYMHPASIFTGGQRYVYAFVKAPAGLDFSSIVPYDHYLEQLDQDMQAGRPGA